MSVDFHRELGGDCPFGFPKICICTHMHTRTLRETLHPCSVAKPIPGLHASATSGISSHLRTGYMRLLVGPGEVQRGLNPF